MTDKDCEHRIAEKEDALAETLIRAAIAHLKAEALEGARALVAAMDADTAEEKRNHGEKGRPDPQDAERDFWRNIDPDTCDLHDPELNKRLRAFIEEHGGKHVGAGLNVVDTRSALWELLEVILKVGGKSNFRVTIEWRFERWACGFAWVSNATNAETLVRAAVAHLKADALK